MQRGFAPHHRRYLRIADPLGQTTEAGFRVEPGQETLPGHVGTLACRVHPQHHQLRNRSPGITALAVPADLLRVRWVAPQRQRARDQCPGG